MLPSELENLQKDLQKEVQRRPDESVEEHLRRLHGEGAVRELQIAAAQAGFERLISEEHHTDDLSNGQLFARGFTAGIDYARSKMMATGA